MMSDIVSSIKSYVKSKTRQITATQALKIQEEYAKELAAKKTAKLSYSAPYLSIEPQIFDSNVQIAQCAVFSLVQTAIHTPKHQSKIIKLLKKHAKSEELSDDIKAYIIEQVQKI